MTGFRNVILLLAAMAAWGFMPAELAATPGALGQNTANTICAFYEVVNGKITRAFSIAAIIFLGISSFFGKINWGTSLIIVTAIAAAHGGLQMATWLTGHTTHAGNCYASSSAGGGNAGSADPSIPACNSAAFNTNCETVDPCPNLDLVIPQTVCEVCTDLQGGRSCIRL